MTEKLKSALQKTLEAEGWRWLNNEDPNSYMDEECYIHRRFISESDAELILKYRFRGFDDVLVANAYDISGKPIPSMRAIYVKGQPRTMQASA